LNSLHPRIICTSLIDSVCWFWRRFFKKNFSVFLLFCYYLPFEKGYLLL
jgi:hypothetical protein